MKIAETEVAASKEPDSPIVIVDDMLPRVGVTLMDRYLAPCSLVTAAFTFSFIAAADSSAVPTKTLPRQMTIAVMLITE